MNKLKILEEKLIILEQKIKETKNRLPAHSTKPPIMMDLLNLEDEYDRVFDEIRQLKGKNKLSKCP